jgi:endoglucanase
MSHVRSRALAISLLLAAVGCGSSDSSGAAGDDAGAGVDASVIDASDDASPRADARADVASDADAAPTHPLPALPLRTSSRWIVDAHGKRFKLASVNWYGAESSDFVVAGLDHQELGAIAAEIRALGFNSVRLPWSNELVESNPVVAASRLTKNPPLVGLHALDLLDAVIAALAHEGLVVVLDNHRSHADWCCDVAHGDGLWYARDYPESSWLADWKTMARRYASEPAVVGADLRNELRTMIAPSAPASCTACGAGCPCLDPKWDGSGDATDWFGAAQRGGNAVLAENPNLLVMVEGLGYSLDLGGVYALPLTLNAPNRIVYSPHDYSFSHAPYASAADMATDLGNKWGFILTQGRSFTAPVWVGELGTGHGSPADVSDTSGQGFWFQSFRAYLANADIDWAYWALNGTQSTGYSRTFGAEEGYGVLDATWSRSALPELTSALQALEPATQGP